ncbi:hypothetical protein E3P99_03252, partial [Wallemia hederae]
NYGCISYTFLECFNDHGKATILSVPRPLNTDQRILVAVDASAEKLYELHATHARNEEDRCWFIDQLIVSSPNLITATPLDPTFLVSSLFLAMSEHARNTYSRYDDLVDTLSNSFTACSDLAHLLQTPASKQALSRCCESKRLAEDELVYKFSTDTYLSYINAKISRCLSTITANRDIKALEPPPHHLLTPELTLQSYKKNIVECVLYSVPSTLHKQVREQHATPDLDAYEAEQSKQKHSADTLIRSNKGYDEGKSLDKDDAKKGPAKGTRGSENLKKVDTSKMMKLDGFFAKKKDTKENVKRSG